MYKFNGTVYEVGQTEKISEKFSKRLLVVSDDDENYPQLVAFEFVNDKTSLLDPYAPGDTVEVSFSLRGREWTNEKTGEVRFFNTLSAFKVEGEAGTAPARTMSAPVSEEEEDEDLPF